MIHNHGSEEGRGLSCNELRLSCGHTIGACQLGGAMAFTGHGHQIPGSPSASIKDAPKNPARCGGVDICPRCKAEAQEYGYMVGVSTDFQEKAKRLVKDYVDSLHKQNFPMTEAPEYTVYVIWFAKALQNWKAILGTTMPDGLLFELTYDGEKQTTYFDCYKKQDNFPVPDRRV